MKNNPVLEAVLDELGTAGATIVSLDQPRHIKIQYEHNGAIRNTTVPTTPSDWRAPLNARAQIRKALNGARAPSVAPNVNIAAGDDRRPAFQIRQMAVWNTRGYRPLRLVQWIRVASGKPHTLQGFAMAPSCRRARHPNSGLASPWGNCP